MLSFLHSLGENNLLQLENAVKERVKEREITKYIQ